MYPGKKYEKQKEFIRNLGCNAHVGLEEDEMADPLIPEDLLSSTEKKYKAVKTTANGDCSYNAASLTLVGNESYATLLRLLVALELDLNADFYAQHPKCTYFPAGGRHPNTVFSLCLTKSSNKVFHDTEHDRKFAILSEAWVASKPKEWSGYFHLTALATVLARPVFSSYPNCQTCIRDFLQGIIYPQMATFSVETVFLLWSREGSDNRPAAWYEPNHSVPLYSAEASDGIDALVDSKTYDSKPSPESPNRCWTFKTGVNRATKGPGCSMVKGLRQDRILERATKRKHNHANNANLKPQKEGV